MKILWLHNRARGNHVGGEDTVALMEERLLRQRGDEVITYDRKNDEYHDYSLWQKGAMLWRTAWSARAYADVVQLIHQHRPDVAHVHNYFPMLTPAVFWACYDQGVPAVLTLHNYRMICANGIFHRGGRHCHDCMNGNPWQSVWHGCVNESCLQSIPLAWMIEKHRRLRTWQTAVSQYIGLTEFGIRPFLDWGIPRDRIMIKPHFIDPDPGVGLEGDYALYVGRLIQNKGIRPVVAAWKQVKGCRLKVIGEGPLGDELRRNVTESGADVEFLGLCSQEIVLEHIRRAKFLIVPSLHHEGFPRVVTEGFACGVPLLVSNVEPLPSLVADRQTGLVFQAQNEYDLPAKIQELIDDGPLRQCMRAASRREFLEKYSSSANYDILMQIYERATGTALASIH